MSRVIIINGVSLQVKNVLIKIDFCSFKLSFLDLYKKGILGSIEPYLERIFIVEQNPISYKVYQEHVVEQTTNFNWDTIFFDLVKKITYYCFKRRIKVEFSDMYIDVRKIRFEFKNILIIEERIISSFKFQWMCKGWATYFANGTIDREINQVVIKIEKEVEEQIDDAFFFDKFELDIRQKSEIPEIGLEIEINIINLNVFLRQIYPEAIKIDNVYFNFELKSNPEHFIITDNSGGSISEIPFAFSFMHTCSEHDLLRMDFFLEVSQQFITSFPKFHNSGLRHIKADGKLVFKFQLMFNVFDPFEYYFSINIIENTLKVIDIDKFDLSFLKDPLEQIESLSLISTNLLPRDIKEISIKKVSAEFIKTILSCEDPSFYTHKGVDTYAVGYALVSNISAKTFQRGASTITMQVARNLFLDGDKNIIRKLEEVIISLLIENHFGISKSRILEIYINIIEFGPGIYGVEQACFYYFGKLPIDISVKESIVLSYIIPRPIHFHDALLLKTPQLLRNLPCYVDEKANELLQKGLISYEDYGLVKGDIVFANGLGRIALQEKEVKYNSPNNPAIQSFNTPMITSKLGFSKMNISEFESWIASTDVNRSIKYIQHHHTWTPNYTSFNGDNHFVLQQTMKSYHMDINGWIDIGQHFTTFPDGSILTGRSLEQNPACILGFNANAICIEHLGDFDEGRDEMTLAQKQTIVRITAAISKKFSIPIDVDKIVYHHWFDQSTGARNNGIMNTKSCPGTQFFGGNSVEDCELNFLPLVNAELANQ